MWISVLEGVGGFPDTRPCVLESSQRPQTHTARSPRSRSWICPHATEPSGWACRRLHISELQEVRGPRQQHTARTAVPNPQMGLRRTSRSQEGSRARTSAPNGHTQDADPRREAPGLGRQPDPAWPQAPALLWSQGTTSPAGRLASEPSSTGLPRWPDPLLSFPRFS